MIRLLHPDAARVEDTLRVEGRRFHYLTRVLRLREGDALEVFDGEGHARDARVARLDAEAGWAELSVAALRTLPVAPPITLLQGLPKGDKLEWVLQKSTELGVSCVWPVACQRSIVQLSGARADKKVERWQRIAEEAARQCARADVPDVRGPVDVLVAAKALEAGTRLLVLDEEARAVRLGEALAESPDAPLALLVGPEGGLARDEVEALIALGGQPVTLGPRILRTETAGLAALAVVQHLRGQLG